MSWTTGVVKTVLPNGLTLLAQREPSARGRGPGLHRRRPGPGMRSARRDAGAAGAVGRGAGAGGRAGRSAPVRGGAGGDPSPACGGRRQRAAGRLAGRHARGVAGASSTAPHRERGGCSARGGGGVTAGTGGGVCGEGAVKGQGMEGDAGRQKRGTNCSSSPSIVLHPLPSPVSL